MSPEYADAAAFRQALESRLKRTAEERGVPLNTLRQKVVMERLLARLFARNEAPWRLKGGYAMELRLAGRARTTRDLDLAVLPMGSSPGTAHDALLERLRDDARLDLGDFREFAVAGPGSTIADGQSGGFRFSVTARLAGRKYVGFHVDIGHDSGPLGQAEVAVAEDHLAFASVAPARVLLMPRERQFAEKLHAYTRPWGDRTNTRTKDLVDLLLLLDLGELDRQSLAHALDAVFGRAGSHALPQRLPPPPPEWSSDYTVLADQVALAETTLQMAYERLAAEWEQFGLRDLSWRGRSGAPGTP